MTFNFPNLARWNIHLLILVIGMSLGCTPKSNPIGQAEQNVTGAKARVVNLAVWANYLPAELLSEFEKRTGIKTQVSNYASNEELLAKLQAGASGFDLVFPSDYMIVAMVKLGLLRELDYSKISNFKLVDSKYLKKNYDPQNKYSIPYDWGTTGIAINRSIFSGQVKGWKDLFNNPQLSGKISLLDDAREVLGAALKAQGYSLNSKSAQELGKAKELLVKMRSRVKLFTSEPLMPLTNGEVAVSQIYMSDALIARKRTGGKVEYVIPEEGGTFWVDNLVIPSGATHVEEAYQLMNFLLEATSNVTTVMSVFVAPTNREAIHLLPKELQNDPMLFPSPGVLARCEMIEDLGNDLSLWERMWTEVKAN